MAATAGTFFIKHNHAGHFSYLTLDVPGASLADGVVIQQFVFHGGPNQQWRLAASNNGFFTITNVFTGKALDVPGGLPIAQLPIQQFSPHGGPNQQWRFVTTPAVNGPSLFRPEFHQIISRATGMAIDVPNGSQSSGVAIQQFPPHSGWNQTWILEPVPSRPVAQGLVIRPTAIGFGSVPVGATATRTLTIENGPGGPAHVTVEPSPSTSIEWDGLDRVLAPGDQRSITVAFTPQVAGTSQATVRVNSDTPGSPHTIRVLGRGTGTVPV